jgi:hypothetical protein
MPRGLRPLIAHCHLGLGKLYRRTDKGEQAQECLNLATKMYTGDGSGARKLTHTREYPPSVPWLERRGLFRQTDIGLGMGCAP